MVWDTVKGNVVKFNHWPNPFPCQIKSLNRLACTPEFVLDLTMTAGCVGNFLFSTFVPSPVEITRKTISGSYKCGFYLPIKVKSPAEIIWKDPGISRVVIGITKPVTTTLFAWWAAETVFSAIDTWQTLHYIEDFCDQDLNSAMLAGGHGSLSTDNGGGTLPFWNTLYDPNGWYTPPGGTIVSPQSRFWQNDAYGYLTSASYFIDRFETWVRVNPGAHDGPHTILENIPPGTTVKWHANSDVVHEGGSCSVRFSWQSHGGTPLFRPLMVADRWIARGNPAIDTPPPWLNNCDRPLQV